MFLCSWVLFLDITFDLCYNIIECIVVEKTFFPHRLISLITFIAPSVIVTRWRSCMLLVETEFDICLDLLGQMSVSCRDKFL